MSKLPKGTRVLQDVKRFGRVTHTTIDRPPANGIGTEILQALAKLVRECKEHNSHRCNARVGQYTERCPLLRALQSDRTRIDGKLDHRKKEARVLGAVNQVAVGTAALANAHEIANRIAQMMRTNHSLRGHRDRNRAQRPQQTLRHNANKKGMLMQAPGGRLPGTTDRDEI